MICVSRENGSVYWIQDLNNTEALSKKQKKKRAKHPILWSTPILLTLEFMRQYDAILCPVDAGPAREHGPVCGSSYAYAYNLTGWPGAVVRAGTSPEGLPIGVQFVAGPWRDYSKPAFGRQKVLRGASFATRPSLRSARFRHPAPAESDDGFYGFRSCAP